jgi:hypothetical protein
LKFPLKFVVFCRDETSGEKENKEEPHVFSNLLLLLLLVVVVVVVLLSVLCISRRSNYMSVSGADECI